MVSKQIPKMNVFLMFILTIVTYGIYYPVWCLRRMQWINSLSSNRKLGYGLPTFILVAYCISAFILLLVLVTEDVYLVDILDMFDWLLSLAGIIVLLVIAFKIRRILLEHFNENLGLGINISGALTFLFTFLYLQYKMNRLESTSISPA